MPVLVHERQTEGAPHVDNAGEMHKTRRNPYANPGAEQAQGSIQHEPRGADFTAGRHGAEPACADCRLRKCRHWVGSELCDCQARARRNQASQFLGAKKGIGREGCGASIHSIHDELLNIRIPSSLDGRNVVPGQKQF